VTVPDSIAALATLTLIGGIVAGTALGFAASWAWARTWHLKDGLRAGMAVGLLVFGLAMSWVVSEMLAVTRLRSGHIEVQGTLISFEAKKLRESRGGRKLMTPAPVVRYTLPDGQLHEVIGLGGSLQRRELGSTVPVHVDPRDPASALIGDFQNLYGAMALFALFAAVSLLTALHSGLTALHERDGPGRETTAAQRALGLIHGKGRARQAAKAARAERAERTTSPAAAGSPSRFRVWRDGPRGQHWRSVLRRAAAGAALLSVGGIFFTAEVLHLGRAFAITAAGLASAVGLFGISSMLAPDARPGMKLFATLIAVLGVGGLAAWLWLLTGY
jgi:hypothetical protein